MPHVEIKYSDNLDVNCDKIFDVLESVINNNDEGAGECKSRAYPCSQYKYSHMLVTISLLSKPYRDREFTHKLSLEIELAVKNELKQSLYFSLNIEYSQSYYTTNTHLIDGDTLQAMVSHDK